MKPSISVVSAVNSDWKYFQKAVTTVNVPLDVTLFTTEVEDDNLRCIKVQTLVGLPFIRFYIVTLKYK